LIFDKSDTSFKIYLTGGVELATKHSSKKTFEFDYGLRKWTYLGISPIGYQGGKGIYYKATNSLRLLTGYPIYDPAIIFGDVRLFVYDYSLNSGSWSLAGRRFPENILYHSTALILDDEFALVHGGQSPENKNTCYASTINVLDLGDSKINKRVILGHRLKQTLCFQERGTKPYLETMLYTYSVEVTEV
jgi:hypothetical protein